MIAEGLDVFLADFGVVCTSGGQTFKGLLDTPDETLNMGGVNILSTMYVCTVKTDDATAAGLVSGCAIAVGGVAYLVRDVLLVDDGAFSHVTLSK
ncbi:hypothetical protein GCM10007933_02410 [Zoogloea oryzae]|uniref:Uncharacterized protein n=1 Tax=Zoogloea oryzae TaxID=310767 RepID=A0ABQ6F6A0_9RHOO|nr:hypothetical protein [Zoogloea oryzae]GLT20789.1 hypothetical protein GCM10007933_02410 [Zoogloea oryzae]